MERTFEQLLELYETGELSGAELDRFFTLLEYEENQHILAAAIDGKVMLDAPGNQELTERAVRSLRTAMKRPRMVHRWYWAAAAVVLLLSTGAYLWRAENRNVVEAVHLPPGRNGAVLTLADGSEITLDSAANGLIAMQKGTSVTLQNGQLSYASGTDRQLLLNTVRTPRGREFSVVLPDGTKVWLNAASSITYPTVFSGNERKVGVTGEVYFEVAKDIQRPFRVNIGDRSEVEVLGTHFNIDSYRDDGNIKTTLLEGSIRMNASVILKPGQQAITTDKRTRPVVKTDADIPQVMAWKNGLFNFNGADLKTVMQQLERWYDLDVRYEGPLPIRKFKGEVNRDLDLSQVLKLLEAVEVKFRIEGRTLIVKG